MTHEELDRLWFQAMEESIKDGEMVARYHFAALVTAAQRDALLAALKNIDKEFSKHGRQHWPEAVKARAAIAKAEEKA